MTSVRLSPSPALARRARDISLATQPAFHDALCRALNVIVAVLGLVVAAPVMAVIAVAIKLTSSGPIFYTQTRIGLDRRARGQPAGNNRRSTDGGGKPFRIFKFRTMRVSGGRQGEVWAAPTDPRVTSIGRILRLYRLDEIPQLINVLNGDMNVVGPRPEQPAIFARLRQEIDGYQDRQRVPPGITGWAQVNQSYDRSVEDVKRKVALDLEYIERRTVVEDMKIMLRTFPVIAGKRGAW